MQINWILHNILNYKLSIVIHLRYLGSKAHKTFILVYSDAYPMSLELKLLQKE